MCIRDSLMNGRPPQVRPARVSLPKGPIWIVRSMQSINPPNPMNHPIRFLLSCLAASVLMLVTFCAQGAALGTAFTYQGRLGEGTSGVNGRYDFMFRLFDSPGGAA